MLPPVCLVPGFSNSYNTSNHGHAPDYQPFDVVDPATGEQRLRSSVCSDFALAFLAQAAALGVRIDPLVATRKSHPVLYTSVPLEPVSADDAEMHAYWKEIDHVVSAHASLAGATSALEAAALVTTELARRKVAYVRVAGADLRVRLTAPYARWSYDAVPSPGSNAVVA